MSFWSRKQAIARILPDSGEKWHGFGLPVIVVASPVHGAGCSTLAAHLAVEAGRTGYGPLLLLDAAPGGSVAEWLSRRNRQTPEGQAVSQPIRGTMLRNFENQGYQLCIVDAKASSPASPFPLADLADLVVVPCPLETEALRATADFARKIRKSKGAATVVVTQAALGQEFWNDITRKLKKEGLLCPAVLHWDDTVGNAMMQGLTAGESRTEAVANADIRQLWEILARALPQPPHRPRWIHDRGHVAKTGSLPADRAKTILVANGDAMLAAHLGAQAIRSGMGKDSVVLIGRKGVAWDAWERSREKPTLSLKIAGSRKLLDGIVKAGVAGAKLCIVEVETAELDKLTADSDLGDLVVVPIDPMTYPDKAEFARFEALARRPNVVFVVDAGEHKRLTQATCDALLAAGGRIAGKIHFDETFVHAWAQGKTVMEHSPESRAAREIVELWAVLRAFMKQR